MNAEDRGRDVGLRLRTLRLALGDDSMAMFARRIGYRPGRYRPYERGERVRGHELIALGIAVKDTTGTSLDWLLVGDVRFAPRGISAGKVAIFRKSA